MLPGQGRTTLHGGRRAAMLRFYGFSLFKSGAVRKRAHSDGYQGLAEQGFKPPLSGQIGRRKRHFIPDFYHSFTEDPGIYPAPAGVKILRYSLELVADERFANRLAGARIGSDLENGIPDFHPAPRNDQVPVETGNREVFTRCPGSYGVTFFLKCANSLERKEAHRSIRPTVMPLVPLGVAKYSEPGDERIGYGQFRNTAR